MPKKNVVKDLTKLADAEAANFDATVKHLGFTTDLLGDAETVYEKMPLMVTLPPGTIESSDEVLSIIAILHEVQMCRMLLTKSVLSALRMYQGDAFTHLRRAIESCAFSVRMSKHHDLSRIWAEAGLDKEGQSVKYNVYRKAFATKDLYPEKKHADYDPLLVTLKSEFDLCSKKLHGSILGMAAHFSGKRGRVDFFDMPDDSFISSIVNILGTHGMILHLFGRILKPYSTSSKFAEWEKENKYFAGKLQRHIEKWMPTIAALIKARNAKASKK